MNEAEIHETGERLEKMGILTITTNADGETVYRLRDHVEMF